MGVVLGLGLMLVWWSAWEGTPRPAARRAWILDLEDKLARAGLESVGVGALAVGCLAAGLLAGAVAWMVTGAVTLAGCFALAAAGSPLAWVSARARKRAALLRAAWPAAIDSLASGIRAGLALPEAVARIADRGPQELRPAFEAFARDYRATGRFGEALDGLKASLADPVADRIVEALRLARDVGGAEVGRILRALATMLRDDARTRGELEARQSWTVNGARLAVAAPWVLLLVLGTRPATVAAFDTPTGLLVLLGGALACVVAYRLMMAAGRLPAEERFLR